jgi:hypothetical protein
VAQPHRTALAARPASIGGSLTPSGNGLVVTVTVQHRLSLRAMSMLANVSRMYAECFDKVLYHVNSQILKCKMTNVITMPFFHSFGNNYFFLIYFTRFSPNWI